MNGRGDGSTTPDFEREGSKIEKEALERKIKMGKAMDHVMNLIADSVEMNSPCLDLSQKNISSIPDELLTLNHLESLYLEGNQITTLPEDFFQKLPNLQWLDLRNNTLITLPSAYIGSHKCLTHLLLQGNQLQNLPLELGLVRSLKRMSLGGNPLKFPAPAVVSQGIVEILSYLRQMLLAKSNGSFKPDVREINGHGSLTDDAEDSDDSDESDEFPVRRVQSANRSNNRPNSAKSDTSEITGKTVSLHKQVGYQQMKKTKMERIKKAGAAGKLDSRQRHRTSQPVSRHTEVNLFPEPPPADLIDAKVKERQLQAITREKNEKIDAILQRRKDEERLRKFREEAKGLQRQKDYEKYMNGGKLDYEEPAGQAPYDVADEDMKVMTNEERIKKGVKEQHERIRKVLSPRALKQLELEKKAREIELREKIQEHTNSMRARRKKPKGNPQEEMTAALKELEIAKRLQQELDRRKRNLDYRFKAYNP